MRMYLSSVHIYVTTTVLFPFNNRKSGFGASKLKSNNVIWLFTQLHSK